MVFARRSAVSRSATFSAVSCSILASAARSTPPPPPNKPAEPPLPPFAGRFSALLALACWLLSSCGGCSR